MKVPACAIFALLMMNMAALAGPPDDFTVNDQAYFRSASGPLTRTQLDSCVQLMERAFYRADPASFDRAMDARREMELARNAFHAGDAFACNSHAIHALEDRSDLWQPGTNFRVAR
jgi:hypothetical protein